MASNEPGLLGKSLKTASSLMLLQLLSRVVTFVLNQSLVRLASPAVFGTASIQFELLLSTILFLSREGVRNALLRAPKSGKQEGGDASTSALHTSIENIALLPALFGIPIAAVTTTLYLYTTSSSTKSQPYFEAAVLLYAASAILELVSEPLYIRAQNELKAGIRVRAEGSGVIIKAATTVAIILLAGEDFALLGFAVGQAVYGAVILGSFWKAYPTSLKIWPTKVQETVHDNVRSYYFDPQLLRLSMAMTIQSVVKHLLTEGDKFIVSLISSLEDQGGYAVASNYGSLVARIIFQPIEETSRMFFSKTLADQTSTEDETPSQSKSSTDDSTLDNAFSVLSLILLLHIHLSLFLLTYGPPYLPFVLSILLPQRYAETSAPAILALYPLLLSIMAFNGTLEAFFASTSTPTSLQSHSRFLVAASAGFGAVVYFLVEQWRWTRTGLVWANMANLAARAIWAGHWALNWFNSKRKRGSTWAWGQIFPPISVLAWFVINGVLVRFTAPEYNAVRSRRFAREDVGQVVIGVASVALSLAVCFFAEKNAFRQLASGLRNGNGK